MRQALHKTESSTESQITWNNPSLPPSFRVAVMGTRNWLEVAAELLGRAGINYEIVDLRSRRKIIRWVLKGNLRKFNAIHHIGGVHRTWAVVSFLLKKPIIWHWIGTDVMNFRKLCNAPHILRSKLTRRSAYKWSRGHLCDSPELANELKGLGIKASVVRLLPKLIEADVEPLPSKVSALSYWGDSKRDFYGGDIVLQLAREFPEIEFNILAATGAGESPQPNVNFLGFRREMARIYSQSTVLIRLPQHDSLSAMVLEMLVRGRYVIYNKELAGSYFANNLAQTRTALLEICQKAAPNTVGAEMVRKNYSPALEAEALSKFYLDHFRFK